MTTRSISLLALAAAGSAGCGDDPCDRYCAAVEEAGCPDEQQVDDCDQACDFGRDFLESCVESYDALIECQGRSELICDDSGSASPPAGACQEEGEVFAKCFLGGGAG